MPRRVETQQPLGIRPPLCIHTSHKQPLRELISAFAQTWRVRGQFNRNRTFRGEPKMIKQGLSEPAPGSERSDSPSAPPEPWRIELKPRRTCAAQRQIEPHSVPQRRLLAHTEQLGQHEPPECEKSLTRRKVCPRLASPSPQRRCQARLRLRALTSTRSALRNATVSVDQVKEASAPLGGQNPGRFMPNFLLLEEKKSSIQSGGMRNLLLTAIIQVFQLL